MVFFLGKNLVSYKRVYYALRVFEGVGLATAKRLCDTAYVHPLCKVRELSDAHISRLKTALQPMLEEQKQKKLFQLKMAERIPKPILPK